jgi:hypothetical protein
MLKVALMYSVSAAILCAASVPSSAKPSLPVTHFSGEVHRAISAVPGSVTLYDQNDDDAGVAVISTVFDDASPIYPQYNSYAADDFTVPVGHKWKIREIDVTGAYALGSDPALGVDVVFYRNTGRLPSGFPIADCWIYSFVDNQGSFAIKLPKSCRAVLKGGKTYWLSVVPLMFQDEWTWETRNSQNWNPAAWENSGDGFGTGCTIWSVMRSCISTEGVGPDFMFTLKGKDEIRTPLRTNKGIDGLGYGNRNILK